MLSDEPDQQLHACCARRSATSSRSGPARTCRAAPPTTCSGSAATPSAPRTRMRVLRSVLRRLTEDAGPIDNVAALQRVLARAVRARAIGAPASATRQAARRDGAAEKQLAILMFDPDTAPTACRRRSPHLRSHRRRWSATGCRSTPGGRSAGCKPRQSARAARRARGRGVRRRSARRSSCSTTRCARWRRSAAWKWRT